MKPVFGDPDHIELARLTARLDKEKSARMRQYIEAQIKAVRWRIENRPSERPRP